MSANGIVFDIQRFSIHDGPGIRTTVFLKGCPLRCPWCHNPESQLRKPQVLFYENKCIQCGKCFEVCPVEGALSTTNGERVNRELCNDCGLCTDTCYAQALEVCGKEMTVEEVITEVEKDRPFYETSKGGMTVSGGEPLAQATFAVEILKAGRAAGLHTVLDTSGQVTRPVMEQAAPFADLVLFDVKVLDPDRHEELIGTRNDQIQGSLRLLTELGVSVIVRVPVIPGYTDSDENIRGIASLAASCANVQEVNLMRYHRLGESKWARLGLEYPATGTKPPTDDEMDRLRELVEAEGVKAAIQG